MYWFAGGGDAAVCSGVGCLPPDGRRCSGGCWAYCGCGGCCCGVWAGGWIGREGASAPVT